MATIDIRFATDPTEISDVYRFRYRIYCEEMRRTQGYADHDTKMICEPLDACARIMVAYEGPELVATLRVNFAREGDLAYYPALYSLLPITQEKAPLIPLDSSLSTE